MFITLLHISEVIALEPKSKPFFNALEENKFFPTLKTLPNIPATFCVLGFLCFLGPIVQDLLIVTFDGTFFLLTLSYLAKKTVF